MLGFENFKNAVMESALNENYSVSFTIAPKKTEKQLNFDDAVAYVKTLGPGWQLPTLDELDSIALTTNNFKKQLYWSSSETKDKKQSWGKSFKDGESDAYYKDAKLYVRAIKG